MYPSFKLFLTRFDSIKEGILGPLCINYSEILKKMSRRKLEFCKYSKVEKEEEEAVLADLHGVVTTHKGISICCKSILRWPSM